MSPGEWIALAALVLTSSGAVGGFVWWLGRRDAQAEAWIQCQSSLRNAVVDLTIATNKATTAIGSLEKKLEDLKEHVEKEHEAMWHKIDMLQDHVLKRDDQRGGG